MKKVIIRIVKFLANEVRKVIGVVTKNKNLETNSYLYDMCVFLKKDLYISRRDNQYIFTVNNIPICILDSTKPISILDMKKFQKVKISLMRIGKTPKIAYKNIDSLFGSRMCNGRKPIAVTIRR